MEAELARAKLDYAERVEQLSDELGELRRGELEKAQRYEQHVQDLEGMISAYRVQVETLTLQYNSDKFELERINKEQIEQIKTEIDQICENKTEQEREIQIFRVQLLEKDQALERERERRCEAEQQAAIRLQEAELKLQDLQR